MIYLLHVLLYAFYCGVFIWAILRARFFNLTGLNSRWVAGFFLLKVFAGVLLTLIYTYYYTDNSKADIYRYFNDSRIISSVLFQNPAAWFKIITGFGAYDSSVATYLSDTQHFSHPAGDLVTSNSFLIRLISVFNYFSFYNIYINTLFFDAISFTGFILLYKCFSGYVKRLPRVLCIPFFLLPAVVFWGSGLLKEPVMIFGIGLYLYGWFNQLNSGGWRYVLIAAIGLLLVALIKNYVAVLLALSSLLLPFTSGFVSVYLLVKRLTLYATILFVSWFYFGHNFCEKIIYKRDEFVLLSLTEKAGSTLDKALVEPDCAHLYTLLPSAIINSFFRPFLWDDGPAFQLLFAIENICLLLASALALLFFFKPPTGVNLSLVLFCFAFTVLNYLLIGITIPIMGAIVHYRIIATPFFVLGVILLLDLSKLQNRLKINFS